MPSRSTQTDATANGYREPDSQIAKRMAVMERTVNMYKQAQRDRARVRAQEEEDTEHAGWAETARIARERRAEGVAQGNRKKQTQKRIRSSGKRRRDTMAELDPIGTAYGAGSAAITAGSAAAYGTYGFAQRGAEQYRKVRQRFSDNRRTVAADSQAKKETLQVQLDEINVDRDDRNANFSERYNRAEMR